MKGGLTIYAEVRKPKGTGRTKEATGVGIHKARRPCSQLSLSKNTSGDFFLLDAWKSLMDAWKQSEDLAGYLKKSVFKMMDAFCLGNFILLFHSGLLALFDSECFLWKRTPLSSSVTKRAEIRRDYSFTRETITVWETRSNQHCV